MSRNRDRLGNATVQHSDPPPQSVEPSGGGFSFVIPTEFVELPSEGRYYPENHPLHNQETIEIKQMTAKEEDMLTSRALLKKGVALDRVIESLIVDKRIDHGSLLVGDRNAIMIAARISGYGSDYTTSLSCPSCSAKQQHSFDLFDSVTTRGEPVEALGIQELGGGLFTTTLPRTKCEVTFKILNGYGEKQLYQQVVNARKKNGQENAITRQLKMITVAVNGDQSQESINYFVNNVPSIDEQHLRTALECVTPNIDLTQQFACNQCDFEVEMEVPLTSDFFWPKR